MTDLFVAGEGAGEIGRWVEMKERRSTSIRTDGVLFELYARKRSGGVVVDGIAWRLIPKYRAGGHLTEDQKSLKKLVVLAEEAGADVLLWARDSDRDPRRAKTLTATHHELRGEDGRSLEIVGGVAEPCLEAWIVGLKGLHRTPEKLSVPRLEEIAKENNLDGEGQMVELVRQCELDTKSVPSLERWLEQL